MSKNERLPDTVFYDIEKNTLTAIDQTLLPAELKIITIESADELVSALRRLAVRGAPAIGVAAAAGLAIFASRLDCADIDEFIIEAGKIRDYIVSARPTAVNLSYAANRVYSRVIPEMTVAEAKNAMRREADMIQSDEIYASEKIGDNALTLLKDRMTVLTHCNAGALATVRYGTALAPLHIGKARGMNFRVYADETRPLLQGARLTAYELAADGIDVIVICDGAASLMMRRGKIDACLVGADRIAKNGDVCNKIGTSAVALAAKYYGVPFYVLAPTSTFDGDCACGDDVTIEMRDESEVTAFCGVKTAPDGVHAENPAFDITPAELVTAIITERGILRAPYEQSIAGMKKA